MDTIYALSSGAAPSAISVIRVSGPQAQYILRSLCGRLPTPRKAELLAIKRPADGELLDKGLVIWCPAPASFTGEDLFELHVHGSRAVITAIFDSLSECGARYAEAGEFSRRAFHNGKLDLTQLEGLADLIASETEAQRRQAVLQADGHLTAVAEGWRETLIGLRAELEARLDFADEEDASTDLPSHFYTSLISVRDEMRKALDEAQSGERVREGFRVAILGPPNAGKSTLLNALVRRDVAIVTAEPGTTRDVLEVALDLGGYPIRLFDTAGIRDTESAAEREGVRRAEVTGRAADLILWVDDGADPSGAAAQPSFDCPVFRIASKLDLGRTKPPDSLGLSSLTGAGMPLLLDKIREAALAKVGDAPALVTRKRQRDAISAALAALGEAPAAKEEVAADLLRRAGEAMSRLTGRIDVEHVLDRLFREFCIGK